MRNPENDIAASDVTQERWLDCGGEDDSHHGGYTRYVRHDEFMAERARYQETIDRLSRDNNKLRAFVASLNVESARLLDETV